LLHGLNKLGIRRFGQKPVKLRAVIIDQADIFGNHVDYLLIAIRVLQPIINRKLRSFVIDKFSVDLGKVLILSLIQEADLFTVRHAPLR
jgi:hypothetical protein